MRPAFAVWITGRPAAGKSRVAAALRRALERRGLRPAVLESDALRPILTPGARYDELDREFFYRALAEIGRLLVDQGIPVIFDATGNRRRYRRRAWSEIIRFMEVHVECPLRVCRARDPKGIYRAGGAVPGAGAPYEPPVDPDLTVRGDRESPEAAARRIVRKLAAKGFIGPSRSEPRAGIRRSTG